MAIDRHEWGQRYKDAMSVFSKFVQPNDDGTFRLEVSDGKSAGIDPIIFADLKRSLEVTNEKILNHEIGAQDVRKNTPFRVSVKA